MIFTPPKTRNIERVFIHCSASDNPKHDNIATIAKWHAERGFHGVGYHYFIRKDGRIETGRSLERHPAAQEGHNRNTVAICLHGLEKENFTAQQFAALIDLVHQILDAYPQATIHGHCEVSKKTCPVFDYREVLGLDGKGRVIARMGE